MNYWLIKTEPEDWSWRDQVEAGVTDWTGVANNQAQMHMRAMKKGDLAFFYHTGKQRQIVGIVRIARGPYPDPSDERGKRVLVDVETVEPLASPVTLKQVKADKRFADLPLVRQSRLSVMPIDARSWDALCELGKTD